MRPLRDSRSTHANRALVKSLAVASQLKLLHEAEDTAQFLLKVAVEISTFESRPKLPIGK